MSSITFRDFPDAELLFDELLEAVDAVARPGDLVTMPTGSTPLALYERARAHPASRDLWSQLRFVQLDEYIDPPAGMESYATYLAREIFDPLNVPDAQRFTIPATGTAEERGRAMDRVLRREGPLRLAVLGLGHNGHIAFNEPADAFRSGYHHVRLSDATVQNNCPDDPAACLEALTISVEQILSAEKIFLVVPQPEKQAVLDRALAGPVDPQLPASALRNHPGVDVFRIPTD